MRLTLGTETAEVTRFMGPKGILEIHEHALHYIPQLGVDTAPSYDASGFPHTMREAYETRWHAEHDPTPGKDQLTELVTYSGPSYDEVKPHLWTFFEAVLIRKPAIQNEVFGHHAAVACHLATHPIFPGNG